MPQIESQNLHVSITDEQSDIPLDKPQIAAIAQEVITHEGQQADEVSLQFVTEERICELHDEFFSDPSATDCISFPMDPPDEPEFRMLGEVFVCPKTALRYAEEHKVEVWRETMLYVIHGLLHLMGYDDIEDSDRLEMRKAEARHLAHLESKGLLLASEEIE